MQIFQFVGAAIGAGLVIIVASVAWPKLTAEPRPETLNKVRDVVIGTEAGQNFANTLGVADEDRVEPVSIPSLAASAAQSIVTTVVTNTQNTVTTKVLESLGKQFNELPAQDQTKFREMICQPAE